MGLRGECTWERTTKGAAAMCAVAMRTGAQPPVRPVPSNMPSSPEPPAHPDALHAPWRAEYLRGLGDAPGAGPASSGSFLLDYWRTPEHDARNFVVVRTRHGMILLNRYPYTNGHLLVALGDPRPTLLDYEPSQRAELWKLVDHAAALLQRTLEPQGINIGVNQGRAAGAGVPQHLHAHLVPRWAGDVNFLSVVGQVRVIPESLEAMDARLRAVAATMTAP